jgi:L-asparaginase II
MEGNGEGFARVRVEVMRGGRAESEHEVELSVVDAAGTVVAATSGADDAVFVRSAIKPFQALPLLEDGVADRLGLSEEELALCCASHSGEARHVAVAAGLLERLGVSEDALACGPHDPFSSAATAALRAEGREPGRIHNNCSGKHAGMLALARDHGWPVEDYHRAEHPVQQRMLAAVEEWTGMDRSAIGTGVDGCGVVTFALPLSALAGALARLAAAAAEAESPAGRVVGAMVRHPFLVAGTGRLCTALMEATGGRILAKVGAEGVYGAAALDREWGIALKVRDGARRGAEVALVGVLEALGLLSPVEVERLGRWARPTVRNTRGEVVGELQSRVEVAIGR